VVLVAFRRRAAMLEILKIMRDKWDDIELTIVRQLIAYVGLRYVNKRDLASRDNVSGARMSVLSTHTCMYWR
jgi:hypothetical protein